MANVTTFLGVEQISRALFLGWKATQMAQRMGLDLRVPIALVGDTGVGKTTAVRAFHASLERKLAALDKPKTLDLYTEILSMTPPEDIGGLPMKNEETQLVDHYMLGSLPFDTKKYSILFCDEFDRAETATQNAALQILLGGEFHGHKLSPNAYPICALNGTSDVFTIPLSQAARTRMCTLFMSRDASDTSAYDKWSRKNQLPEVCRLFNTNNSSLFKSTQQFEELAVCTPRTLDMAGLITLAKNALAPTMLVEDIYFPMIAGVIGLEAATAYVGTERMIIDNVRPMEIIDNPEECELMEDPSMVCYVMRACLEAIKNKYDGRKDLVRAVATYALRYDNAEWTEVWMLNIVNTFPEFVKDKVYQKWVGKKQRTGLGLL